jgi:hypothetical protein
VTRNSATADPRYFFYPLRVALLALAAGYGLDILLSQMLLVQAGLDPSVAVQFLPDTDEPHSNVASWSYILIVGGHALAFFGALLGLLGSAGTWREGFRGPDRLALAVAFWGLAGFGFLLVGPRYVGIQALTYVDSILFDVLAISAVSVAVWMRLGGQNRKKARQDLLLVLVAAITGGLSSLAVTAGASWMVVFALVSALVGLHLVHQLLGEFTPAPSRQEPTDSDAPASDPKL